MPLLGTSFHSGWWGAKVIGEGQRTEVNTQFSRQAGGAEGIVRVILRFVPGALAPALIGVLTASIFTRLLNEEQFGLYSMVLSVVSLVSTLASQWLQQGVGRYLPGSDNDSASEIKSAAAVVLAFTGLVGAGLVAIALVSGLWLVGGEWKPALVPTLFLIVATSLFNSLVTILQAQLLATRYTFYQTANVVLRFVLSLVAILLVSRQWVNLVWAGAVTIVLLLPLMWRDSGLPSGRQVLLAWRPALVTIRQLAVYGFPMIGWFVAATVLNLGDRFILQWFRGAAEVGIYSANYTLVSRGAGLLAAPVLLAAHPLLMATWSGAEREGAGDLLGNIVEWFVISGLLVIGTSVLFAGDVTRVLLGPGFRAGYGVLPVVLAGEVIWQLGMYTQKPLEFIGATGLLLKLGVVSAVANIVMNVVFVPHFGYMAAAYSTLASYALYILLTGFRSQAILPWRISWRRLLYVAVVSAGGFAAVGLIRWRVDVTFGYGAGLVTAVIGTLGLLLFLLLRFLKPALRRFFDGQDTHRMAP